MRRTLIGWLFVLHGLAHSALGFWAASLGPEWLVTPLWWVAQAGFVAAGAGLVGVSGLRRIWAPLGLAAALSSIDRAAELNPKEPEFDVWRAWVLFLVDDDKKGRRAGGERAIEAALKANPRCMPAYLFLGQMAKLTGDLVQAERYLRRGLAIDSENPELQRELKHLRK